MNPTRIAAALLAALLALPLSAPAASADHQEPTTWRTAMLIYANLNALCPVGGKQRVKTKLSRAALQEATDRAKVFSQKIEEWSAGHGRATLTFFYPGNVTKVSQLWNTDYCWVGPQDIAAMGHWPAGFDAVFVQHPEGLHPYGGLALANGANNYGSTYATTQAWETTTWFWNNPWTVRAMVHEWLHGVTAFYRKSWSGAASPADAHLYGYEADVPWYRALLSGTIEHEGAMRGLTPPVWASGTP